MDGNLELVLIDLKAGQMVLVTDSHDREDEADLLMAAEFITPEKINFFLNHARGLITNPVSSAVAGKLNLQLMVPENAGTLQTAFTVSIDAVAGTHTGISSRDRSVTIKKMSEANAGPLDFERPGHVFPLIAHDRGVLGREGHTEAAIDLLRLAGLTEVAVLCETLNESGDALKGDELVAFSRKHNIRIVSIEDVKQYRLSLNK